MINETNNSVHKNKVFYLLILITFMPSILQILNVIFITNIQNAVKVMSQISFLLIIYKVFEETALTPLFKILSEHKNNKELRLAKIKKYFTIITLFTAIFTALIYILLPTIISFSEVPSYIVEETILFFQISVISLSVTVLIKLLYQGNLISKNNKNLFIYLCINVFANIILNIFSSSSFSFSLNLGAIGIAISGLIVNVGVLIFFLIKLLLRKVKSEKLKVDLKEYFKLSGISFAETFIRNLAYYVIILTFLNIIDGQDSYYLANGIIWNFLLVPTLAQNSLIVQDYAEKKEFTLKPYFKQAIITSVLFVILTPLVYLLFRFGYNLNNYTEVFYVYLILVPFYVIFNFDAVIETYFVVIGKLNYVLIQTVVTNVLLYGTAFVLYLTKVWIPTLFTISLLMGLGVFVSSLVTVVLYFKQKKLTDKEQK